MIKGLIINRMNKGACATLEVGNVLVFGVTPSHSSAKTVSRFAFVNGAGAQQTCVNRHLARANDDCTRVVEVTSPGVYSGETMLGHCHS